MTDGNKNGLFKEGKSKAVTAVFLVFLAAVFLLPPGTASEEGPAPKPLTVKAWIDKDCRSHPGTFEVPAGETARDFKSRKLEPGSACHEEGAPENVGFAVRDPKGRPVYMWSRYKDQKPYEKGGPLESLNLGPGEYTLSVAGGAGASIELSFVLK